MGLSIDKENVIKEFEHILNEARGDYLDFADITVYFGEKVLALLKEQDAVEPEQVDVYGEDEWWGFVCVCPDCKTEWMCDKDATHFCPNCGRPVKWE